MLFRNQNELIENGATESLKKMRNDVLQILTSAIDAMDPYNIVSSRFHGHSVTLDSENLDLECFQDIYLVGFGKASIGMAQAICDSVDVKKGIVITNDISQKVSHSSVRTITGGHPLPDENSVTGTKEIEGVLRKCSSKDLVFIVISGGGSALLCHPRVGLEDMQRLTNLLLNSGATIEEINTVRKHVSFVKGGNLVKDLRCPVVAFIISDVVNDPIEFIASGPTCGDDTTFDDAISILKRYEIWNRVPQSIQDVLNSEVQGNIEETPSKDDVGFSRVHNIIVGSNKIACDKACNKAKKLGYKPYLLSTSLIGESRDVGCDLVKRAKELFNETDITLCISGGETTVTVNGDGKGGRNQEMVLSILEKIDGMDLVFASFATDGVDGMSPGAGAIADGFSLKRAQRLHMNVKRFLSENDSFTFFSRLNDVFITGPTGTNVMDIQLIMK